MPRVPNLILPILMGKFYDCDMILSMFFNVVCNRCWDWWGYTDKYYGVNTGKQVVFVRSLIKAVTGK